MASVLLTWKDNSTTEEGQRIYRSLEPMDEFNLPAPLAEIDPDVITYTDETAVPGETYYYRLSAYQGSFEKVSSELMVVAGDAGGGDPHWDKVVSLLHFEDSLVGNSAGADWSVSGSPLRDPVDPLRGGYSLGIYDNNSDVYAMPPAGFGSRPSTVEFLMRPRLGSSLSDQRMFCLDRSASAGLQGIIILDVLVFYRGSGVGSAVTMSGSTPIVAGQEYHVALTHDGTTLRLFLDGNLEASAVTPSWILTGQPFRFGRNLNPSYSGNRVPFVGELDELRITDGVARYTENFTPPTKPFPNFGP